MKKIWTIPVCWEVSGVVRYESETLEEAIRMACDDDGPLPEGDYVDGSFSVTLDEDYIRELYNNGQEDDEIDE